MIKLIATAVLVFLVAHSATAQSVLGVAVIDGKRVELLDDQTWRFALSAENTNAECRALNGVVSFCGSDGWKMTNAPSPDFLAAYSLNSRSFGGVIYEGIGTQDGVNAEFMRDIIINFAANATGVPKSQIPILDLFDTEVDGVPAQRMSYALNLNGVDVIYQNTILLAENHTIQFLVWTLGQDYTDVQKDVAEGFVEHMRVDLEAQ